MKTKSIYYMPLDGVRLMASISIVLFHMSPLGLFSDIRNSYPNILKMISAPAFHASIFFLLGGFIYYNKFSSQEEKLNLSSFLKVRFLRLYPLHFITTVGFAAYIFFYASSGNYQAEHMIKSVLAHLSLIWAFFPNELHTLNQPSWAISSFFVAYLLFPYALKIIRNLNFYQIFLFVAIWVVIIMFWWSLLNMIEYSQERRRFFHIFPPIRALEFFLGMLLARIVEIKINSDFKLSNYIKPLQNKKIQYILSTVTLYLIIDFIVKASVSRSIVDNYWLWVHYHAFLPLLYMIALYIIVSSNNLINRILSFRLIRELGKSSFTPYLLHIPLISIGANIYVAYFKQGDIFYNPWVVGIILFILYFSSYAARKINLYVKSYSR